MDFLMPNQFAWKPWFIRFVFEHTDIQNIFWIDSGIVAFGKIRFILNRFINMDIGLQRMDGSIIILNTKNVKK